MAYPEGRKGAGKRRDALLCLIYFAGGENYQLAPRETYDPLAEFFDLSEYERNRTISYNDDRNYWENLIQNSREQLRSKGYLDGSVREVWQLTPEGIDRATRIESDYSALKDIPSVELKVRRKVSRLRPESNKVGSETATFAQEKTATLDMETPVAKDMQEPAGGTRRDLYTRMQHLAQVIEEGIEHDGSFDPSTINDERVRVARELVQRRGQRKFREMLIALYNGQCAISGTNVKEALEAAHIIPYSGGQTNHPANGLLLRSDIHNLFDFGLIAIDEATYSIIISKILHGSSYQEYDGRKLYLPESEKFWPSREALKQHREEAQLTTSIHI